MPRKKYDPTKPNKKRWIYGVGAKSGRKPYYPPVIPVITPGLRDEIIEFLTTKALLRQDDQAQELQQLVDSIRLTEDRVEYSGLVLTTVQQRQLLFDKRRANELAEELNTARTKLETKVAREVANLALLRGVREIFFDNRVMLDGNIHRVLAFHTAPIKINSVPLGTYNWYYTPAIKAANDAFDLWRRDGTHERGVHPHFSTRPCYGTFGPAMHKAHNQNRFQLLFGLYMQYLAIYDSGSPLISISRFKPTNGWNGYVNKDPIA